MAKTDGFVKKLLHGKTFAIRKSVVFALVGGLLLGSGGVLLFQWYNPKDEPQKVETLDSSMIMSRIVERNEMIAASQDYTIVEKAGDKNRLFDLIDIPFTQNSFWYLFAGTIEASVDLSAAQWEETAPGVLTVTLPEPELQNVPNMDISGVLEEHNNVLNPIHVEDVDTFQRDCVNKSNQQAEDDGLREAAKENALKNLQGMFDIACGPDECKVEIVWVSAEGGEQGE